MGYITTPNLVRNQTNPSGLGKLAARIPYNSPARVINGQFSTVTLVVWPVIPT